MSRHPLHYFASIAVALTAIALVSACGPQPVSPLPGQSKATPSAAPSATPTASAGPTASRPRPPVDPPVFIPTLPSTFASTLASTVAATFASACLGRVEYEVDLSGSGPPPGSLCLTVGSVVIARDIGPGYLTTTPADSVSCDYEAAVHQCRLLIPGNVTFTNAQGETPQTLLVVVIP